MNKKAKLENVLSAAGRHLIKRNFADPDVFKRNKLRLQQTEEQFENSNPIPHRKVIAASSCSVTEHEADVQYSRLKSWVESLDEEPRAEMQDLLFPAFISLYRKLNSSGNSSGARSFYARHQSNFFKVPEFRKMAERFCSEGNSHFTLDVTQETFDVLSSYAASSEHPVLQYLLNTTLEVNIVGLKSDKTPLVGVKPSSNTADASNGMEEVQDLMAAIARMNELPPTAPLLKIHTIDTGQRKMCTASVSSCHGYLASGFQDSSVAVWDMKKLQRLGQPEGCSLDLACAISSYHPPSSVPPSPSSADPSMVVCHGHSGPVYSTVFTPTNTHLLTASDDTTLRLWELDSMENRVVYRGHTYPVWAVDISQQNRYFASGSQDRTAKLWTFERTYPIRIFAGHTADVDCVAFHPNESLVATGSADRSVRVWSVAEGNTVRILVGHHGTVLAVAFSPCGKLLATAGEDHRVKVWDVRSNSILQDLNGHHDVVHGLVWISETLLGSYSADGSLRVWNVAQGSTTTPPGAKEFASYSVPSPWKPVYLGRGQRSGLVCIAASD